ncbi:hypothetical protein, partial [Salmonella enterica]|uniref:hypothetical protein n=1 Tax=Salmonella enterica TaxID=28901 RepID=UPI003CF9AEDE
GKFKYVQSKRRQLPDNGSTTARAKCPKGTQVSGGGVDTTGLDIGLEVAQTFPKGGREWIGSANNDNTGSAEKMQSFAVC